MSLLAGQFDAPFPAVDWQPEVMALLDERHLGVWSHAQSRRSHFAASLAQFLGSQRETDVVTLYGRFIKDIEAFCHQLERSIPVDRLERRLDGTDSVTDALRSRESVRGRSVARCRFIVWNDADVLLRADPDLFGRLVDAMLGVSAEAEYASEDLLLIQRCVFVGGAALAEYAERPDGQFRSWLPDGLGEPFWALVTGVDEPQLKMSHIDELMP
ncbi:MAG: hypothetical protein H6810_03675 [Phycisphaeraceae bacterium]|nr:MAG: hypothetical protein H6810_03675 [Phycisphaeraceae bacterium]